MPAQPVHIRLITLWRRFGRWPRWLVTDDRQIVTAAAVIQNAGSIVLVCPNVPAVLSAAAVGLIRVPPVQGCTVTIALVARRPDPRPLFVQIVEADPCAPCRRVQGIHDLYESGCVLVAGDGGQRSAVLLDAVIIGRGEVHRDRRVDCNPRRWSRGHTGTEQVVETVVLHVALSPPCVLVVFIRVIP